MICPICSESLSPASANIHVNSHFEDLPPDLHLAVDLDRQLNMDINSIDWPQEKSPAHHPPKQQQPPRQQQRSPPPLNSDVQNRIKSNLENAFNSRSISDSQFQAGLLDLNRCFQDGVECHPGVTRNVISALKKIPQVSSNSGNIFCSDLDHYPGLPSDKGFGCSYRNTQMLLSSLQKIDTFRRHLFPDSGEMFSIFKLQQLLDSAANQGFPVEVGPVHNTNKQIGATEVAVLLSSLRLHVRLAQFSLDPLEGHSRLLQYLYAYFCPSGRDLASSSPPPLYLQFAGHSITIIGVGADHSRRQAAFVWSLNSGMRPHELQRLLAGESDDHSPPGQPISAAGSSPGQLQRLKLFPGYFKKPHYQLVKVVGLMSPAHTLQGQQELESAKLEGYLEFHS